MDFSRVNFEREKLNDSNPKILYLFVSSGIMNTLYYMLCTIYVKTRKKFSIKKRLFVLLFIIKVIEFLQTTENYTLEEFGFKQEFYTTF